MLVARGEQNDFICQLWSWANSEMPGSSLDAGAFIVGRLNSSTSLQMRRQPTASWEQSLRCCAVKILDGQGEDLRAVLGLIALMVGEALEPLFSNV